MTVVFYHIIYRKGLKYKKNMYRREMRHFFLVYFLNQLLVGLSLEMEAYGIPKDIRIRRSKKPTPCIF
jgi:hypothetical protein